MTNTINTTQSGVISDLARDILPRQNIIIVHPQQNILEKLKKQLAKTK